MPIEVHEVAGATQFDGTANQGLFGPHTVAGSPIQIRINSLLFHCDGTAPTLTIAMQDPDRAGNTPVLYTASASNAFIEQTMLPAGWTLVVTTTGKDDTGWLTLDYDFAPTEGG